MIEPSTARCAARPGHGFCACDWPRGTVCGHFRVSGVGASCAMNRADLAPSKPGALDVDFIDSPKLEPTDKRAKKPSPKDMSDEEYAVAWEPPPVPSPA